MTRRTPNQITDQEQRRDLHGVTHIVSPVWSHSHFAVFYYDLMEATVTVFDGLHSDIRKWERHVVTTLKIYNLKPLDAIPKSLTTTSTVKNGRNRTTVSRIMQISFTSDIDPDQAWADWTVFNDTSIRQVDGINCGPIACIKVMEAFGILGPGSLSAIAEKDAYRMVVMNYYKKCISKYKNDIFLEVRRCKVVQGKTNATAQDQKSDDDKSDDDNNNDYTSVARSLAMQKRNKQKKMRRSGDTAI